ETEAKTPAAVVATVDCTLPSERRHIRQFAYDGDESTYYESAEPIAAETSFTFKLDAAVDLKSVDVLTGTDEGEQSLAAGVLEAAGEDGEFREVAKFADGKATAESLGQVKTLRIRPEA